MTVTSSTETVDVTEVIYNIVGRGSARGDGVISYVNYTKGENDNLLISFAYMNNETDTEHFYSDVTSDSGIISVSSYSIPLSGLYRIPISIAQNEDVIKMTFSGLVEGSVNVEFEKDSPYL